MEPTLYSILTIETRTIPTLTHQRERSRLPAANDFKIVPPHWYRKRAGFSRKARRDAQFTCRRSCVRYGPVFVTPMPPCSDLKVLGAHTRVPRLKEVQSSLRGRLRLIYSRNLLPRGPCTPAIYFTTIISGSGWQSAARSSIQV